MSWIDASIIFAFVAYSIWAGFSSKERASQNLEEYFLAGRSLKGGLAGLSMAATQFSADTPLLVTGLIATAGIFALWQLWIYALSFLLIGFLLAPQWRRAGILTDAELSELRYGARPAAALRLVKAVYFGTIFNCVVLAWVLFAAAKIAEPFLPWDLWLPAGFIQPLANFFEWINVPVTNLSPTDPNVWIKTAGNFISLFAIAGVTTLYSMTGGLRSVVMTDFLQLGLMLVGTWLFSWYVVDKAGGLSAIHSHITQIFSVDNPANLTPTHVLGFTPTEAKNASGTILALFALQWIIQLNSDGTGYIAQRVMACSSDNQSKLACLVLAFVQVLLRSLLWIPLGLGLLVLYPFDMSLSPELQIGARESTYVLGMSELLPVGVKGIVVTAMLAALASTVDTHLNWGSSYWTNDIYKRFICEICLKREPSQRSLVWIARMSNLSILFISLIVMTQLKSIQEAWQISLLLGAGMGPALLFRWMWWRVNAWAEIAAIMASTVLAPILILHVDNNAARLLLIAVASTVATLIAVYVQGPEDFSLLKRFYQRVRPSGFWGPIAEEGNRDAQNLFRALSAAFCTGFSLFCLLVGFGSWIAHSPTPFWFPWPHLWIPTMLVIGFGLIPVWIRLGFSKNT